MWTLVVLLIVLALVILAVCVMVRNFKRGKNSCGMNCSACMSVGKNKTCAHAAKESVNNEESIDKDSK